MTKEPAAVPPSQPSPAAVHQGSPLSPPTDEPETHRPLLRSLVWLPRYVQDPATLREDVLAGLTVGVMSVPQSMAYAMIAGLPPIYGLYTALVQPLVYAFIGDSRHLQVGPVSMVSLLTHGAAAKVAGTDVQAYVAAATLLALLAGVTQVLLGVCRLGALVDFASRPVIAGFTSGASVVVIVSQAQHVFGVSVKSGATSVHTLANLIGVLQENGPHYLSLCIGSVFLLMLYSAKALSQRHPTVAVLKALGPLSIVVVGTAVCGLARLDRLGVKIIKEIPSGLPGLTSWPTVATVGGGPVGALTALGDTAVAIAFISFMESIAVTKTLSRRHGYEKDIDANQELIALGTANACGSLFQGYAGAGAFSRSAVASDSGARTQVAALCNAVVVAVTLAVLTPAFHYLPKGVLSAIVMQAVYGLIDLEELRMLIRVSPRDALLWVVAFAGTLHTVHLGIVIAVSVSVVFVMKDASAPVVERVRQGRCGSYVPASAATETVPLPEGVLAVQICGALYGSGCTALRRGLEAAEQQERRDGRSRLWGVAIDVTGVPVVDSTALSVLQDVCEVWRSRGVRAVVAGANPRVLKMLEHSAQKSGDARSDFSFPSLGEAVEQVRVASSDDGAAMV